MLHLLETNKYIITFVLTTVIIILGIYFLYYKKKIQDFDFKEKKEEIVENYNNLSPSLATLLKNNNIKLEQYYNIIKYYNNIKKEKVSITENTQLSDLELDTDEKEEITKKLQELNNK